MGLFSSKKKISVSSTVYNLAGEEADRPQVIKSLVLRHALSRDNVPFSKRLNDTLTRGSSTAQRKFYNWALSDYTLGMPSGSLGAPQSVDSNVIQAGLLPLLGLAPNQTLEIIASEIDGPDIEYWAETWIYQNRPELEEEDWTVEYQEDSGFIKLTILEEAPIFLPLDADLIWATGDPTRLLLYIGYMVVTQDPDSLKISFGSVQLFTYRMGTGNVVFDALRVAEDPMTEFFPALPLRLKNKSIRDPAHADKYDTIAEGFTKLTGRSVDSLLDQIEENESIDDIDFAFMIQGVNLGTEEKVGLAYLYRFFANLKDLQKTGLAEMTAGQQELYLARLESLSRDAYYTAHDVGQIVEDENPAIPEYIYGSHPEFGTPLPLPLPAYAPLNLPQNVLQIRSPDLREFDIKLTWSYIQENQRVGNGKTYDGDQTRGKMKPGDYWLRLGPSIPEKIAYRGRYGRVWTTAQKERVVLVHQYSRLRYRELELVGLEHVNTIYKGRAAITKAGDALQAIIDGEESGFIIPLHHPTWKELSGVQKAQLSTVSSHLVFNAYVVTKVKWYQRGIFKVILVAVGIVLALPSGGASLGASVGILGANAAVGAAIGASVASAAVVGAIANYIAAIVVSQLIQWGTKELIGGKWGEIIGAVVSFVAMSYAGQYARTGNFNLDWSQLMRAENMLKLTNSVSEAYSRWIMTDTAEIVSEATRVREEYESEFEEIENLSDEILGMTNGLLDPMIFTDATEYFGEPREAFLQRTLLTGSDIANLTHAMIENFVEITLELPRARSAPMPS